MKLRIQILPNQLKAVLTSAFALMTIIPLLCAVYLLYRYMFLNIFAGDILMVMVLFALLSAFVGFELLMRTTKAVIRLAEQAKAIKETGELKKIEYKEENEIGTIVSSFNTVMGRLKDKVDELENMNHQLQILSITDELTGLYNFRSFKGFLDGEVSRSVRKGYSLTLLMIDLDNFKNFNDENGHLAGNGCLKKVSQLLRQGVRLYDIVARYGGDEFAVILPETDEKNAMVVARRLQNIFSAKEVEKWGKGVSLSIGMAAWEGGKKASLKPSQLIEVADQALYRAKAKGKGSIETDRMTS